MAAVEELKSPRKAKHRSTLNEHGLISKVFGSKKDHPVFNHEESLSYHFAMVLNTGLPREGKDKENEVPGAILERMAFNHTLIINSAR